MGSNRAHNEVIAKKAADAEQMLHSILFGEVEAEDIRDDQILAVALNGEFCGSCDACYDAEFMFRQIHGLKRGLDKRGAASALTDWKRATATDQAMYALRIAEPARFERTRVEPSGRLYYLDQNILSLAQRDASLHRALLHAKGSGEVRFVHSPSHLEEIAKIEAEQDRETHVEFLEALSDEVSLQPNDGSDSIVLFHEPLRITLKRVMATIDASKAIEQTKLLGPDVQRFEFPEYLEESGFNRSRLNQSTGIFDALTDQEFAKLVALSAPASTSKDYFKGRWMHSEVRSIVYSLHNAMDVMGYKCDKSERKLRSSIHDVEHLIYASSCSVFVTRDGNLRHRAREIFDFMGRSISVLDDKELLASIQ
ncbi:TPA: hypothetical protein UOJ25_003457 [Stenotrophomonas maltophilia]|nr:hypothetical protein [Stenotrophomonas maltophilia]